MATFDAQGRQIPDQRPVDVPVGFSRPLSLQDEIRRFVRVELSKRAVSADLESFQEADDFDVEDEVEEFASEYEIRELAPEAGDADAAPPPAPKRADPKAPAPASKAVNGGSSGEPPPVAGSEKPK